MNTLIRTTLIAVLLSCPAAWAQDDMSAADAEDAAALNAEMHALEEYVGPGKQDFIDEQLELSDEEAAKFWPIYDQHQAALRKFNQRRLDNILAYARAYNDGSLDDKSATAIAREALDLEKDEAVQMEHAFNKLRKVIPAIKAARYLQIENKLRAIVRFEQAARVPYAR